MHFLIRKNKMKKNRFYSIYKKTLLLLLFTLPVLTVYADSLEVKKGMTLWYKIIHGTDSIKLEVRILEVSSQVSFDFIVRGNHGFYGRVMMSPEALQTGIKQFNFSMKGDVSLKDATSLWISQLVYNTLKNVGEMKMAIQKEEKNYKRTMYTNYLVKKDGKMITIPCMLVESDGNLKEQFFIADNKDFPIILSMNLGFPFELIQIDSPKETPEINK